MKVMSIVPLSLLTVYSCQIQYRKSARILHADDFFTLVLSKLNECKREFQVFISQSLHRVSSIKALTTLPPHATLLSFRNSHKIN